MLNLQVFMFVSIIVFIYFSVTLNHILDALRSMSQDNQSIDERGDLDTHAVDIKAKRRHLLTLCRRKYIRSKHGGQ